MRRPVSEAGGIDARVQMGIRMQTADSARQICAKPINAAKSNSLAAIGNRPLRYRNWLIIQRAREGRGDLLGAREAETESTKLAR